MNTSVVIDALHNIIPMCENGSIKQIDIEMLKLACVELEKIFEYLKEQEATITSLTTSILEMKCELKRTKQKYMRDISHGVYRPSTRYGELNEFDDIYWFSNIG